MKKGKMRLFVAVVLVIVLLFSFSVTAFALGDIFGSEGHIANFLKKLFVPDKNYFHNQLADLSRHFNNKFGGIAVLYLTLNNFFQRLNDVSSVTFALDVPNNFLYRGYQGMSIDVFTAAKPFVDFLRTVLTTSALILTAIVCYKKLLSFFRE